MTLRLFQTMPPTIYDLDASNWTDIAVETFPDGSFRTKSFEELVEDYDNPDLGDQTAIAGILDVNINKIW